VALSPPSAGDLHQDSPLVPQPGAADRVNTPYKLRLVLRLTGHSSLSSPVLAAIVLRRAALTEIPPLTTRRARKRPVDMPCRP
jgi:hypothetical protein